MRYSRAQTVAEQARIVKIDPNKTHPGAARKRTLKPVGYFLIGGTPCKSRSNSRNVLTRRCASPCKLKVTAPARRCRFRPKSKH